MPTDEANRFFSVTQLAILFFRMMPESSETGLMSNKSQRDLGFQMGNSAKS